MEILIDIDDSDFAEWQKVADLRDKIQRGEVLSEELSKAASDLKNLTSSFWDKMLVKYAYLRNKRLAINAQDKYIFSWNSYAEFARFSK